MTTTAELQEWCVGAQEELGDASLAVCQLFFRWSDSLFEHRGEDLICGMLDREVHLLFADGVPLAFPLITSLTPTVPVRAYGARRVAKGLYEVTPSLNMPGIVHAFIVLYGVPEPPPWERLVIIP